MFLFGRGICWVDDGIGRRDDGETGASAMLKMHSWKNIKLAGILVEVGLSRAVVLTLEMLFGEVMQGSCGFQGPMSDLDCTC